MHRITRRPLRWGGLLLAAGVSAALVGCSGGGGGGGSDEALQMLIAPSEDAERTAVEDAAAAWSEESGVDVEVVAAKDLKQQLGQGFAGNNPPDIFYGQWEIFETYAAQGYLEPYASDLSNADEYYPALVDTFTYEDEFYCAPKDFATLGLVINPDAWAAAGLTDADIPTDWEQLRTVAQKLTTPTQAGISFGPEYYRIGVFMNQAGGTVINDDATEATADSSENAEGLDYVKQLIADGSLQFPADLDAGWSGEAFGQGKAAMVIEGPWLIGALNTDFPDRKYLATELPAGPGGQSTYTFTNCWAVPAGSDRVDDVVDFVEFLTTDEQQLKFSEAFGVIPSKEGAAAEYAELYPERAAFVAGNDYAVSPVKFDGVNAVVTDFSAGLESIATADSVDLLASFQENLQSALDEANG